MTNINLKLLGENLISSQSNFLEKIKQTPNNELTVLSDQLVKKYPSLKTLKSLPLITFKLTDNDNIAIITPKLVNYDDTITLLDSNGRITDYDTIIDYSLSEYLSIANVKIKESIFTVNVLADSKNKKIKTCNSAIEGKGEFDISLLKKHFVYLYLKDMEVGKYQVTNIYKQKTQHKDCILDVINLETKKEYKQVVSNTKLNDLIKYYKLDTQFEITGKVEKFLDDNKEEKTKVVIKDLLFDDSNLADIQLF